MTNVIITFIHQRQKKANDARDEKKNATENIHVVRHVYSNPQLSIEWIKCDFALNNNLRINKFRAKMSTYYLRAFIKCSIHNYF